jgi:hypothetical protein
MMNEVSAGFFWHGRSTIYYSVVEKRASFFFVAKNVCDFLFVGGWWWVRRARSEQKITPF